MYNILICDDEQDIINALKIYLSNPEYSFFEATNGRMALETVEQNDIHLILMDIMMPGMDGISAMVKIREISNEKRRRRQDHGPQFRRRRLHNQTL